jgi:secondary thiamine-phosphate synthase enzyme
VAKIVRQGGISTGTATVFVRHTSCSLVIMENAAPAARRDLEAFFERLVPEDADYEHDDEGPDDSTSHIRMLRSAYHPKKAFGAAIRRGP